MSIYQPYRSDEICTELGRAGEVKIWPQLESEESSLNHQPAAQALMRSLMRKQHIVLEGLAGSGKTVLSLYLATTTDHAQMAYLEAQRWAPDLEGNLLHQFLSAAGCHVDRALHALEEGNLVFILDAIDEAPWRARGTSLHDAVEGLSDIIEGRAGLLITSRLSTYVPALPTSPVMARLAGIKPNDIEAFLTMYSGGRSGVAQVVKNLRDMPFREAIKYSPLVLRFLAQGLSVGDIPDNLAHLFEDVANFHIKRECSKASKLVTKPEPGSWQACYANPVQHRLLVCGLAFSCGGRGRAVSEEEFSESVIQLLGPEHLGARALVDISTLMQEHPLVSVSYQKDSGKDFYCIDCGHDWVRTALLPKFLTEDCLEAQTYTLDRWHECLPQPDDFVLAWSYLGERIDGMLETLCYLVIEPEQARDVTRWLLVQLFNNEVPTEVVSKLFATIARLAYKCVPPEHDIVSAVKLSDVINTGLFLENKKLVLAHSNQVGNLSRVSFDNVDIIVEDGGPGLLVLRDCLFTDSTIKIGSNSCVKLESCILPSLDISAAEDARLELKNCTYDPLHCTLPPERREEACTESDITEQLYRAFGLAEVLRRFVRVNLSKLEVSQKKPNVAEHNVYRGIVVHYQDIARSIISAMVSGGYLDVKPTGSVRRYDPTGKFDAYEAAQFIERPSPSAAGSMTRDILDRVGDI